MKIVVNTRLLLQGKLEGIGWFTYENLRRITTNHPEHTFYFLFDRPYHPSFIFGKNVIPVVIGPQARHPVLYYIWFGFSVWRQLKKLKADLFLSPDGYLSLKTRVPSVAVFHDLNFEHYPKDVPFAERWYYRHFFRKYAHKAKRIATVSEFSKLDIITQYNVDPARIDVVYNGANEMYSTVSESIKTATRAQFTNGQPYFFFVGSLHPRKNLVNLFRAFDVFKQTDTASTKLLIAGARKWWTGEISAVYDNMQSKEDVIFTGRLEATEMHHVVGSAIALTYVSYFEGFGIPIIEAFRCGTPVITSNVTSMPEIAGNAALIIDPFDHISIAQAMQTIVTNNEIRQKCIGEGLQRATEFTWDKSTQRLWQCMMKAMED